MLLQTLATLLGRLALATIFILSGIAKLGNIDGTTKFMAAHGLPLASVLFYLAVLIELGGGVMVASGFRARRAALVLFLFMCPVTYFFHFKPAFDGLVIDQAQRIQCLKNLAIMGGLLLIYGNGAGQLTIGKDA